MSDQPAPKSNEPEELAHADDAIIGRAARRSVLALAALAMLAGGAIYLAKRKPAPPPPQVTRFRAPIVPDKPKAEIPGAPFADITRQAGITFAHNNGAYGD